MTEIYNVPISTFESMNIKAIFLLTDDIDKIRNRLLIRDGKAHDKEKIFNLQKAEIKRAKYIASKLNISIIEGSSSKTYNFLNYFNNLN